MTRFALALAFAFGSIGFVGCDGAKKDGAAKDTPKKDEPAKDTPKKDAPAASK